MVTCPIQPVIASCSLVAERWQMQTKADESRCAELHRHVDIDLMAMPFSLSELGDILATASALNMLEALVRLSVR